MEGVHVTGAMLALLVACGALVLGAWGCPHYKVYHAEMEGTAELMQARQNRQIKIEEAQSNLEAEKLNAQAEIERARGMAEAMKIENGSLTPEYIQYLWVRSNQFNNKTTIYIPTEAGLPVMEAGRFRGGE